MDGAGFVFVADEGVPAVWRLSSAGEIITETILTSAGVGSGQLAKVTWHRCVIIMSSLCHHYVIIVSSLCHHCLFTSVMSCQLMFVSLSVI